MMTSSDTAITAVGSDTGLIRKADGPRPVPPVPTCGEDDDLESV